MICPLRLRALCLAANIGKNRNGGPSLAKLKFDGR